MSSITDPAPGFSLYTNLKMNGRQIRLLEITSTAPQITCKLEVADLDDEPSYSALSYVWGDPQVTKPIIVNGKEVAVTTNLACALAYAPQHLELANAAPRVWVDAVCINQGDTNEKNTQVPLMKDVFSKADTVLCWLGPPAEPIFRAMDIIETVAHERVARGADEDVFELQKTLYDLAQTIRRQIKALTDVLACKEPSPMPQLHELRRALQHATNATVEVLRAPSRVKPILCFNAHHILEVSGEASSCIHQFQNSTTQADDDGFQGALSFLRRGIEDICQMSNELNDMAVSVGSAINF